MPPEELALRDVDVWEEVTGPQAVQRGLSRMRPATKISSAMAGHVLALSRLLLCACPSAWNIAGANKQAARTDFKGLTLSVKVADIQLSRERERRMCGLART